ncbi:MULTISPECIES: RluA family pseudouridine synthase [Thioalkalivibrio]|uniref:Pseudouridine synthase n=1 Tax=Thioalkalivibrio halophilus TaxID=252474 RepID=A0A1V3A226_9GAMM|nr:MULTISPECIES: RluA family pseudouridine synthase [Thioalkalivibrio]OOC11372.1 pseudouridine synthase [Thioalkalivibrio halophilus]
MKSRSSDAGASGPRELVVGERADGQRLDNFLLRELKGVPRSLLYRLIRKGAIRVDGRRVSARQRLATGSKVRVPDLERPQETGTPDVPPKVLERLRGAILFEDDDYLVLDKPSGLAVHGGSGLPFGIIEAMRVLRPDASLELGHRLDRETSGCLVLAKGREPLQALHEALRDGRVDKRYLALLVGRWKDDQPIHCDAPLGADRGDDGRRRMSAAGDTGGRQRAANSVFMPLEAHGAFQLAEVRIGTGRTHQIRVHGREIGHPVAGDHEYGLPDANRRLRQLGLERLFLHAQALRFEDGRGEERIFSAPMPDELQQVLENLDTADTTT